MNRAAIAAALGLAVLGVIVVARCGNGEVKQDASVDASYADDGQPNDAQTCLPKATLHDCTNCWIDVNAGTFTMGSPKSEWGRAGSAFASQPSQPESRAGPAQPSLFEVR